MFVKFFRYRKYKKKVREIAVGVNKNNEKIIDELIQNLSYEKDCEAMKCLQFEARGFLFWLFLKNNCLASDVLHKLVLDEMHDQYYSSLKKDGYSFDERQKIANKLNERYQAYNQSFFQSEDPMDTGYVFQGFINECAGKMGGDDEILVPLFLLDKSKELFEKLSNADKRV